MKAIPRKLTLVQPILAPSRKVTIVGTGEVGTAIGYILLLRRISDHIVFINRSEDSLKSLIKDLEPCSSYYDNAIIEGTCTDFSKISDSQVCIMAAGVRILPSETKLDVVQRNVEVLRAFIPHIVKYCPDCIIIMVSFPIEIMTYFAWKMSKFPANRVFGATNLYSKSFHLVLAQHLNVSADILSGWIVGEYGDSGVPLWSGINVAGTRVRDVNPHFGTLSDEDKSYEVQKELMSVPHKISILKGGSTWAPAFCVAAIVHSILHNRNEIFSVTILAKGVANIDKNIFLSLPCQIGCNGASRCLKPRFTEDEQKKFEKSADVIDKKIRKCTFWTVNSPII